jgi:predicted dehydrogenase
MAESSSHPPVKVGIVGCGKISAAYFTGCKAYPILDVVACADLDVALAQRTAREQQLAFGGAVDELLARPEIEIVVNLTIPAAHAAVNRAALAAGKHVYCEKPFALSAADTQAVLDEAAPRRLRVGSAPDTFLGSGIQTARRLIDEGAIGRPVAAFGFMLCPGHESWHPNPAFYYQAGGGPMFDMGPYYITALVNLLGPVARVSGVAQTTYPERLITSEPRRGQKIPVETPTHYSTTLEFASGAVGTLVMSFDTHRFPLPNLVVFGTEGNLRVPDPNHFDGVVQLARAGVQDASGYSDVPNLHATGRARGTGVADLAQGLRTGRHHRASGKLAHHVVEVMEAAARSSTEGRHIGVASTCERPPALPATLAASAMDD